LQHKLRIFSSIEFFRDICMEGAAWLNDIFELAI